MTRVLLISSAGHQGHLSIPTIINENVAYKMCDGVNCVDEKSTNTTLKVTEKKENQVTRVWEEFA